jgi:hypothetical protein
MGKEAKLSRFESGQLAQCPPVDRRGPADFPHLPPPDALIVAREPLSHARLGGVDSGGHLLARQVLPHPPAAELEIGNRLGHASHPQGPGGAWKGGL